MCNKEGWVNEVTPIAFSRMSIINRIRSRPASTPTPETCETCEWMIRADEREKRDAAIRNAVLKKLLDDVCKQCPVREEHMPLEDYCAESCDECLINSVVAESLHTPENPCTENGCTDIEGCDEICEHSRIYSPAWVQKRDAAIRNSERQRVLTIVCAYLHYSQSENERDLRETKNTVARTILKGRVFEDMMILEALEELRVKGGITLVRYDIEGDKIESLRTTTEAQK
jgi:hypothetical protein